MLLHPRAKGWVFGAVGPPLWTSSYLQNAQMDPPPNKKFKKSHKPSQHDIFPGIPADIATSRPPGFRAELDVGPKGEWGRSYHDLEADWPDPTVVPDIRGPGPSRIAFPDKDGEDRLPTSEVSALGAVAGSTKHEHVHTSEFLALTITVEVHTDFCASHHQGRTPATLERKKVDQQWRRGVCVDTYFLFP